MRFKSPQAVMSRPVRVCAIQYALKPVQVFDAFAEQVERYVDVGDDYDCDVVLFPELLGAQLLGCLDPDLEPAQAMRGVAKAFTGMFDDLLIYLAREYDRIIVAGTFPRFHGENLLNVSSIYVPGQEPVHQPKLHLTPSERSTWNFEPGHSLDYLETDFGRFAVSICYDIQFPEIARVLATQGVQLLLVPCLTDDRRGQHRVTLCAQARAVENQIYVATAGMVGSLPLVTDLTAQYAQSGIYTPADFAFPPNGIAAEAAPNVEMVIVADLDLALLDQVRESGSVLNFRDADSDALQVTFQGPVVLHQCPWQETV